MSIPPWFFEVKFKISLNANQKSKTYLEVAENGKQAFGKSDRVALDYSIEVEKIN